MRGMEWEQQVSLGELLRSAVAAGAVKAVGALGVFWGQMKSRERAVAHLGCPLLSNCTQEMRT